MVNNEVIGKVFTSPTNVVVDLKAINDFQGALGEELSPIAPLTFSITISLSQAQELLTSSGLNWDRVVHGEQGFKYYQPITAGQEITTSAVIEEVKSLAGNEIATVRIDLTDAKSGELLVSTTSVLVVRA
jgi:hypothetical protein